MQTRALDFQGPAGRLEGLLMLPEGPATRAAVLCHAHPLHGGVMRYKVLYRSARALRERGCAVLRFNFRGVGRSEGEHDGGRGEQDDLRSALDWLEAEFPSLPLLAGGYSFGSVVSLRVGVGDPRVASILALGFPVQVLENTAFVQRLDKPCLFVQGEEDEFGDGEAMRRLVDGLTSSPELVLIPGSDHFFSDRLDELEGAVSSWRELL